MNSLDSVHQKFIIFPSSRRMSVFADANMLGMSVGQNIIFISIEGLKARGAMLVMHPPKVFIDRSR